MAYKVIILYQLYMPSYFLGTFTEYPYLFSGLRRILLFEGCEPFGYRIYPYFFEKIIRNRMSGDL